MSHCAVGELHYVWAMYGEISNISTVTLILTEPQSKWPAHREVCFAEGIERSRFGQVLATHS